uniref:Uncharacterized protein n=1 Tax=Arundo donax TaxID=35708 RepID=A0A0A9BNF1_ARUDO
MLQGHHPQYNAQHTKKTMRIKLHPLPTAATPIKQSGGRNGINPNPTDLGYLI